MSEEQTHLLHQEILKALRDANQAQNGIANPSPARKPMTDRGIMDLAKSLGFDDITTMDFAIGFRFAEKHHGITASDLTLQYQCRGDKL